MNGILTFNVSIGKLLGTGSCQTNHTSFGGCIIRLTRITNLTNHGSHINDSPIFVNMLHKLLDTRKGTGQVHVYEIWISRKYRRNCMLARGVVSGHLPMTACH